MKQLRLELGLTQADLAEMMGCSVAAITAWERGRFQGNSPVAAELPRRAIDIMMQRKRRKARKYAG